MDRASGQLGRFHRTCGKNVELSEDNTVANRVRSYFGGMVYSEKPVIVGTMFSVQLIVNYNQWGGNIALGLTSLCPDEIWVPTSAYELRWKQNYWFALTGSNVSNPGILTVFSPNSPLESANYSHDATFRQEGQSLGCMVNEKGELHFFIDGEDQGVACTGLPTDQPLWGFVDIYGKAKTIKSEFYTPQKPKCSNCLQLEQQLRVNVEVSQAQEFQLQAQALQQRHEEAAHQLQQQLVEAAAREQESQSQLQLLQQRLDTATVELEQLRSSAQVASQQGIEAWKVPRGEVQVLGEMDRGAWGIVARGRFQGQLVAVKWPHPAILNEHTIERLQREVRIMAQVRHPNLLRFIAAVFDDQMPRLPPLIVMELLDTNLRTAYQNGRLLGNNKVPIFRDVAYALHYLHEHQEPIIHRDVSAPNVLLEELPNQMWRAKVSDFGSANLAKMAQTMGEGAIIYAAPETIPQAYDPDTTPPPQTTKIDVFSYGVLLCEVITCQFPDPAQYRSMLRQIQSQWQFMHELIVICTKRNPEERPTMARVLDKLNKLPNARSRLQRRS